MSTSKPKEEARDVEGASKEAAPTYHETSFQSPPSDYSIFLRDTVMYRTEYISLILGPQYEANRPQPTPLFYVSVHMEKRFSNKTATPQIRLHYGPDGTYPVIGTVRFRASTTSDVTVWHDSKSVGAEVSKYDAKDNASSETKVELVKTGAALDDVHSFYYTVLSPDRTLIREKFEWRHSGDTEVKALATENHPGENICQNDRGLKLVKASSGQLLAVFATGKHQRVLNPKRVAGKLRFTGAEVLDPLIVAMTILSIMERGRRNAVSNANSSPFSFADCLVS